MFYFYKEKILFKEIYLTENRKYTGDEEDCPEVESYFRVVGNLLAYMS